MHGLLWRVDQIQFMSILNGFNFTDSPRMQWYDNYMLWKLSLNYNLGISESWSMLALASDENLVFQIRFRIESHKRPTCLPLILRASRRISFNIYEKTSTIYEWTNGFLWKLKWNSKLWPYNLIWYPYIELSRIKKGSKKYEIILKMWYYYHKDFIIIVFIHFLYFFKVNIPE